MIHSPQHFSSFAVNIPSPEPIPQNISHILSESVHKTNKFNLWKCCCRTPVFQHYSLRECN